MKIELFKIPENAITINNKLKGKSVVVFSKFHRQFVVINTVSNL